MTHAHMDETYLHLVTSLLMEKDTLFRADRSDSMTSEDRDDFLPLVSEFLIPQRDRAFSWDVSFEEGLSHEATQALMEQTRAPFPPFPALPNHPNAFPLPSQFYYKQNTMLPPTTVGTKLSTLGTLNTLKIPAIIEEDFTMKFLTDITASKKEALPIKKRKIPEKSDSAVKKSKIEKEKNDKNEKEKNEKNGTGRNTPEIPSKIVPSEGDFAKSFTKRIDTVVGSRQSPAATAVDTKAASGKKNVVAKMVVSDEKVIKSELTATTPHTSNTSNPPNTNHTTNTTSTSNSNGNNANNGPNNGNNQSNASNIRLPTVPSLGCLSPKGVGQVTPVATSPSSAIGMLLPQATWNDYGVYQPAATAPNMNAMGGGLQINMNLSRIPLLASDFGPANGIVIGDGCRVGVYTREERLVRIERFREKKLKRIWRKQIKYDCRKRLADTRPRVKGRFVSRIGENGEELPPEPKPDTDSIDGKKKKKKLPKACQTATTSNSNPSNPNVPNSMNSMNGSNVPPKVYAPYAMVNTEGANGGDTTQESEEGEDAGDSICSDGGDSLSFPLNCEMLRQGEGEGEHDENQISLEDSLGHIIDIICGDDHDNEMI